MIVTDRCRGWDSGAVARYAEVRAGRVHRFAMAPPVALWAVVLALAAGCATGVPPAGSAALAGLNATARPGPGRAWPLPPGELEHVLMHEALVVRSHEPIGRGVTGAAKEKVDIAADGDAFALKWKPVPAGDADGWNNSPRRELAAYEVQKWFLDPEDYVVPTSALRCSPLERYRLLDPDAEPTIPGVRCVLGWVMVWLEHVTVPERLYERDRFLADPAYAFHFANFNLLTYLIDHRDGRAGNFLVSDDATNRRVFSVDNGIAFDPLIYNYFTSNWHRLRVPAVRREAVARLRRITAEDIDALGVVADLAVDEEGILRYRVSGPNLDPDRGARVRPGHVQFGLTRRERRGVAARLAALLAAVDAGTMAVY